MVRKGARVPLWIRESDRAVNHRLLPLQDIGPQNARVVKWHKLILTASFLAL